MLGKILSLVLNCNGRLERESTKVRETNRGRQTPITGGSETTNGRMVSGSDEKKIPDPWFN